MRLKKDRAFSLVEMIVVVLWLGILAAIAVPRLNRAAISRNKAHTTARKIVTDLRLTHRLAISHAADNTQGYELQMVPPLPYAKCRILDCNPPPTTVELFTIDSDVSVTCPVVPTFRFGPLGNLELGSGTKIIVSAEGKSFTISIIQATGAVKCVEN